jgi:hypothetical protein
MNKQFSKTNKKSKMDIRERKLEIEKLFSDKMDEFIKYQNTGACVVDDDSMVEVIKKITSTLLLVDKVIWYNHPNELPRKIEKITNANFFYPQYLKCVISESMIMNTDINNHEYNVVLDLLKNVYGWFAEHKGDGYFDLHVIRSLKYSYEFEKNQSIFSKSLIFNRFGGLYKICRGGFTQHEWLSLVKSAYLKEVDFIVDELESNPEFKDYIFNEFDGNVMLDIDSALKMVLPEDFDSIKMPKTKEDMDLAYKLQAIFNMFGEDTDEDGCI